MTSLAVDCKSLKLTVAENGDVWVLEGDGMPVCTGLSVDEFIAHDGWERLRVVGTAANAHLILRLYARAKGRQPVEVCSPLCCESAEDRRDPEVLLYSMRFFEGAPSVGGWHAVGSRDIPSYLLAAHFQKNETVGPQQLQAFSVHPAYPALSFVQGIDSDACCHLLAEIVDPRWYIDLGDPDRGSRLGQFLGLNPRTQAGVGREEESWRHDRCKRVLTCWRTGSPPGRLQELGPRQFLWRVWHARGGGVKGDLAGSKLFVAFLRAAWTDAVCQGPKAGHLFVPEIFFQHEDEAKAYREHLQARK